jgi:hypothetical protein
MPQVNWQRLIFNGKGQQDLTTQTDVGGSPSRERLT